MHPGRRLRVVRPPRDINEKTLSGETGTNVPPRSTAPPLYSPGMPDRSFLPALPTAIAAVRVFRQACAHIRDGNSAHAAELIRSLDDIALRAHYDNVQAECGRRLASAATAQTPIDPEKASERMPGAAIQRSILERDGWRCRWCTTPIIIPVANNRMTRELPDLYPRGTKNVEIHGLIMCSQGSIDHVIVHSLGGTNDPDNLVTACWPCQFARGELDYTRLGLTDPRLRPPIVDDWDGCHWFTD